MFIVNMQRNETVTSLFSQFRRSSNENLELAGMNTEEEISDWQKAANKLLYMTRDGLITWKLGTFTTCDEVDGPMYWTQLCGRRIVVYRYTYPYWTSGDRCRQETGFTIMFANADDHCASRWQVVEPSSLYWAIGSSIVGADTFLEEFLSEAE